MPQVPVIHEDRLRLACYFSHGTLDHDIVVYMIRKPSQSAGLFSRSSYIDSFDRNALIPSVLHHPCHLLRRLMTHHRSHKVQARI